ncbi:MAG: hypothetical protein OXC41_02895 [Gammaproteobacteria bacterium]|nr:hypothetical protein [Gammaproteobacteria bacterium]
MDAPRSLANETQAPMGLNHFTATLDVLCEYKLEETTGTSCFIREPAGIYGFITPWN